MYCMPTELFCLFIFVYFFLLNIFWDYRNWFDSSIEFATRPHWSKILKLFVIFRGRRKSKWEKKIEREIGIHTLRECEREKLKISIEMNHIRKFIGFCWKKEKILYCRLVPFSYQSNKWIMKMKSNSIWLENTFFWMKTVLY